MASSPKERAAEAQTNRENGMAESKVEANAHAEAAETDASPNPNGSVAPTSPQNGEDNRSPPDARPESDDGQKEMENKEEKEGGEDEKANDEATETVAADKTDAASPPPLPDEPVPEVLEDDGWDPMWSEEHGAWYFYNRFTQSMQWENPRVPTGEAATEAGAGREAPEAAAAAMTGGYNPAIHGDYDPNAWYARGVGAGGGGGDGDEGLAAGAVATEGNALILAEDAGAAAAAIAAAAEAAGVTGPHGHRRGGGADDDYRFSHNAKAQRQMNAYFDVEAASTAHDGRSLKAERSGRKPSRSELKAFKEKRKARKEEKRRAWLRD